MRPQDIGFKTMKRLSVFLTFHCWKHSSVLNGWKYLNAKSGWKAKSNPWETLASAAAEHPSVVGATVTSVYIWKKYGKYCSNETKVRCFIEVTDWLWIQLGVAAVVLMGNKMEIPGNDVVWMPLLGFPPQALPCAGLGVTTGATEGTWVTVSFPNVVGLFQVSSEDSTRWCYFSEQKPNP